MDDQRELPEAENSDVDSSGSSSDENNITVIPAAGHLITHRFSEVDLTALDSDEEAMDDEGGRSSHVAVRRVRFSATAEADLPGPSRVLVTPDLDVRPGEATAGSDSAVRSPKPPEPEVRYSYRLSAVERGGPYGDEISISSLSSDSEDDLPGPSCSVVAPDVAVRPREAVAEADLPGPSRIADNPHWPSPTRTQKLIWAWLLKNSSLDLGKLKLEDFSVKLVETDGELQCRIFCPFCEHYFKMALEKKTKWRIINTNYYEHIKSIHLSKQEKVQGRRRVGVEPKKKL